MKERLENRIVGAIRWIDAISRAPVSLPLAPSSDKMRFQRNLSGFTIISHADGLEAYEKTFDLQDLSAEDAVGLGSLELDGQVVDPTGTYLPRRFTITLPRDPSPELIGNDKHRPPNSLFTPIDIELLPSPSARLPAGWAQVRVLVKNADGVPIPNAIARVVANDSSTTLGIGQADSRGEVLVAIAGLKHFAPGETEDEVVSVETPARLEILLPPPNEEIIDWTDFRETAVADGNTDPEVLQLEPGGIYSRRYPFTT